MQELVSSFIVHKLKVDVCNISRTFIFSKNFYVREKLHTFAFFRGNLTLVAGEVNERFDDGRVYKGFPLRQLNISSCRTTARNLFFL